MLNLNARLRELEESGRPIRVGVVGAGQMGSGLVALLARLRGMKAAAVADVALERARSAFIVSGADPGDVRVAATPEAADEAIAAGRPVVAASAQVVTESRLVDVVVEATGLPEVGAEVAYRAIQAGKHVVMLNVEADVTVGPFLAHLARQKGVVYTGSAGDEPAATKELFDFADALGFEVLVAGKGKNNPLDRRATPDRLAAEAAAKRMNPKMLTSFVDGTKTMVEMTCLANATGLVPDCPGMHGVEATLEAVVSRLRLQAEGGVLSRYGVVEYVNGIAPGVFVIIRSDQPLVNDLLRYLKMGEGPNFLLYRPYHLTSLETPISVARAFLYREPTIAPAGAPVAETVAVAKRDLAPGDELDGLGGYTVYGLIYPAAGARATGALPAGLALAGSRVRRAVPAGRVITYDDVELRPGLIADLRREQDRLFGPG